MRSFKEFNLKKMIEIKEYQKSPEAWDEQIFYFLLIDRFAAEKDYPLYNENKDFENALKTEAAKQKWLDSGESWNGGTLKGIINKLDYLKELGVSVLWISPTLKQPVYSNNYHGYGTQNFLEIEPHFGSKDDLQNLVKEAHKKEIYIILDVILNHTADVFLYDVEDPFYTGDEYPIKAFRNKKGEAVIDPKNPDYNSAWPEGGVWPEEIFDLATFSKKGYIRDWDSDPEYREGDFFSLKNIDTGSGKIDDYSPSEALKILTECYKYWIAYADLDGFRLDTVKHLDPGAVRYFVTEIKEFTQTLGKKDFYIVGEITGGMEFAKSICENTGLNAALGINKIPENLENIAKGYYAAENYFSIFTNSQVLSEGENQWYHKRVITMFDDHDMVYKPQHKERFTADKKTAPLIKNAVFLNFFTAGIPCIYYGTEQGFDGSGDHDKYVREAMFGGDFGAFRTRNKSFFNRNNPIYKEIKKLAELRNEYINLRLGRQYLREISEIESSDFHLPQVDKKRCTEIIVWSRIFSQEEFILAVNCELEIAQKSKVLIDSEIHLPGEKFTCIYSSDEKNIGKEIEIKEAGEGRNYLEIEIPAKGRAIYKSF